MILRGIKFGPVFDAAGVEGLFGEGYPHHRLLGPLGPKFAGSTFVSKTTTLEPRQGNMPMKKDGITSKEILPKCILPNFRRDKFFLSLKMFLGGYMLNSVGLSGPGAEALFETGRWQKRTEPFFLSFSGDAAELKEYVELFKKYLPNFRAPVGLQLNESCSNIGKNPDEAIGGVIKKLEIAHRLHIPLMPKFNILAPVCAVREISRHHYCDAICISNTIPLWKLPERIDWKKLFGPETSPLAEFGGGGLSGKPLLPLVVEWVHRARNFEIKKPINAGGGILSPDGVVALQSAGASSVFVGSVATLRPWRVQAIIKKAHELFL